MSDDDPTDIIYRPGQGRGRARSASGHVPIETNGPDDTDVVDRPSERINQNEETEVVGAQRTASALPRDLVRGWLVVVSGPGQGRSLEIGTGQNQIGRDSTNRIALPFGDRTISREIHAVVVYDPRSRSFFVSNNQVGANLTYLNGDVVLSHSKLTLGDQIQIGATYLRFVPFCGEAFDWSDIPLEEEAPAPVAPPVGSGRDGSRGGDPNTILIRGND